MNCDTIQYSFLNGMHKLLFLYTYMKPRCNNKNYDKTAHVLQVKGRELDLRSGGNKGQGAHKMIYNSIFDDLLVCFSGQGLRSIFR